MLLYPRYSVLLYPGSPHIVPWHRIQERGKEKSKFAFHILNWYIPKWTNIHTVSYIIRNIKVNNRRKAHTINKR